MMSFFKELIDCVIFASLLELWICFLIVPYDTLKILKNICNKLLTFFKN